MTMLVVLVMATVGISAACSFYEAILYSTRTSSLEVERSSGSNTVLAARMIAMKKNISVPIAAILILNTLAMTGGSILIGIYAGHAISPDKVPLFSAQE